jgi:hypothetical protein
VGTALDCAYSVAVYLGGGGRSTTFDARCTTSSDTSFSAVSLSSRAREDMIGKIVGTAKPLPLRDGDYYGPFFRPQDEAPEGKGYKRCALRCCYCGQVVR